MIKEDFTFHSGKLEKELVFQCNVDTSSDESHLKVGLFIQSYVPFCHVICLLKEEKK